MEKESIMKALGLAVAAVLTGFVAMASAQDDTNSVYSANVVGVIRKTIAPGQMILISVPLDDMESTNATIPFKDLPFLSSLPNKSTANIWDPVAGAWVFGTKNRGSWTGLVTNESLSAGQSMFIKNGGTSNIVVSIVGEVPEDSVIPIALANANQMQGCANPYPVAFEFGTSALASNAVNKSSVNFWDPDAGDGTGDWVFGAKTRGSWDASVRTRMVAPAEGFIFKNGATAASGQTWDVSKPYVWPEN